MIDKLLFSLTLFSALGCGLVAGAFFAFSTFVMNALVRLPPAQGIAAMQSINVAVINPLCGMAFFGTAATCVLLAVSSLLTWLDILPPPNASRYGGGFLRSAPSLISRRRDFPGARPGSF